jgi:DNA replication ATP-dependent helicase Dna2
MYVPAHPYAALLAQLRDFVFQERDIATARRLDAWERPLQEKLDKGLAQRFRGLEAGPEPSTVWACLAGGESRFREGDQLCLHSGSPFSTMLASQVAFESEDEKRWLLRCKNAAQLLAERGNGYFYAEQGAIDLSQMFEQALDDIAHSASASRIILPLLEGELPFQFNPLEDEYAFNIAVAQGLNALQAEAVGKAFAAEHVACIQGPPGTGKTKVLALAARLMVERGERVMITSHTHTAINNALGKIAAHGVPSVKVGSANQARALAPQVARLERFADWKERPAVGGYVVGATPFATCSVRLEQSQFDTILFDEASQITVPLALMAMRRGKRFVFIGDQQQLPPVVLSRSVLSGYPSVFSRLTADNEDSVMLRQTYRMNRWLAAWPSRTYYGGALEAVGPNAARTLALSPARAPSFAAAILRAEASAIFVPTRERGARACNMADAGLATELCAEALAGGLALDQVGIVTPYRAQGRAIRKLLARRFGWRDARLVVADTVERMQGQEREVVILSLATSDLAYLAAVAEFFFQRARLNVSVTRAMTKLIIIGPDVAPEFSCGDEQLARNIANYRALVASCTRMAHPP